MEKTRAKGGAKNIPEEKIMEYLHEVFRGFSSRADRLDIEINRKPENKDRFDIFVSETGDFPPDPPMTWRDFMADHNCPFYGICPECGHDGGEQPEGPEQW